MGTDWQGGRFDQMELGLKPKGALDGFLGDLLRKQRFFGVVDLAFKGPECVF